MSNVNLVGNLVNPTELRFTPSGSAVTRPLVYVAGPITGDPWGCVRRAVGAARSLDPLGFDAYLPQLSILHEIVDPQPYQHWIAHGLNMVSRCDGLIRLSGESPGAELEVEHAKELGLPVIGSRSAVFRRDGEWREWIAYVRAQHAYRLEGS